MKKTRGPKVGREGPRVAKSVTVPRAVFNKAAKHGKKNGWNFSQTVTRALRKLMDESDTINTT